MKKVVLNLKIGPWWLHASIQVFGNNPLNEDL